MKTDHVREAPTLFPAMSMIGFGKTEAHIHLLLVFKVSRQVI